MKRLLPLLLALIIGAPLAQGEGPIDETRFTLREEFLRLINRDRKQFGLSPVQLDAFASSIADAYCKQQIQNGTTGHFTTDGQAPYMRYSFRGGNDGVSENAAAWSANYSFGDRTLYEMMRRSEDVMMGEIAPHDGHRRTILDPYATHVGIGLAWERGEFRLTQEFIRRYIDWSRPLPRSASNGEHVLGGGRPVAGYQLEAVTVHFEPLPQPISALAANTITSYSLPDTRRECMPRLHRDGSFSFLVPLAEGPGVYTVVVWVKAHNAQEAIAASNISIRVSEPGGGASAVSISSR
jgi:uncharacterized protein YkwD